MLGLHNVQWVYKLAMPKYISSPGQWKLYSGTCSHNATNHDRFTKMEKENNWSWNMSGRRANADFVDRCRCSWSRNGTFCCRLLHGYVEKYLPEIVSKPITQTRVELTRLQRKCWDTYEHNTIPSTWSFRYVDRLAWPCTNIVLTTVSHPNP